MATLTDAFLADLDALSDGDDDVQKFDLSAKEDIKEVRCIPVHEHLIANCALQSSTE